MAGEDEHRLAGRCRGAANHRHRRPPDSSSRPASNRSRSPPTTTARCSNIERPANDHPTSATSSPSWARRYPANRAACAHNAASDFADTTHGTTTGRGPPPATAPTEPPRQSHARWCH
ncbi:hypothetical protein I547_7150 [Mycobacterium kansasii 824]|nr:hypothetical protein I547_7150 [Mycobacterium kansasii 824]